MSAGPGKVRILDPVKLVGDDALPLDYIQVRAATRVGRPFLVQIPQDAVCFDGLTPFSDADRLCFDAPQAERSAEWTAS